MIFVKRSSNVQLLVFEFDPAGYAIMDKHFSMASLYFSWQYGIVTIFRMRAAIASTVNSSAPKTVSHNAEW